MILTFSGLVKDANAHYTPVAITNEKKEVLSKKIKALTKKLRQIDELKGQDLASLNDDQIKKLKSRTQVEKDLKAAEKALKEIK